ncbi:MAG TPA: aldehyde ferredoxin oxidoreductase, partial [Candidatus Korarchaeota archaeon]|nr:aldehyde ferredoxin oxidoreductase [Candidatus Korarchaeota archaeon]
MKGWTERLLKVDLSSGEVAVEQIPREVLLNLLGGKGLGAYLLYKEAPRGVDPFSPENPLIFAAGPISGLLPGAGRYAVITKSPLTGYFIDSHASGSLGAQIKFAGFDAILIKGKAEKPVYLYVEDGSAEIRGAEPFWGLDVYGAHDRIYEKHYGGPAVATIGPAGENLVRFAVVHSERLHAAGRGGTGAVMGSKNLKALA